MAHELSTRADGLVEMAFVGDTPWHGLGQKLDINSTIDEWKVGAGMDWSINEATVAYTAGTEDLKMAEKKVLYRSDTKLALSVVGSEYKVIQPGEVLEFFRDLVDGTGMYLETAGCLFDGRRFWAMANTQNLASIGSKNDTVRGYLMLCTSADGTMATTAQFQSVRTVCNNTLRIALAESGGTRVRVTHRSQFDHEMVKRKLGVYADSWANFIDQCDQLVNKVMTDAEAKKAIDDLILSKPNDPAASSPQSRNNADFVFSLYKGQGMGADMVYGSAYGVLQAVTEYVDHHSRNRTADARLWNQFFGPGDALKQEAFAYLMALI